ncbi:MAG: 23S rRNA (adenine(2503)-C(2))-methyltransferase RlmN [Clostridiales bacterium]
MSEKKNILDLNLEELKEFFISIKEKEYRVEQVFKWIYQGVTSFDEMSNIPKELRNILNDNFSISKLTIFKKYVSKVDYTKKYLYQLIDGNIIETVFMKYKHGNSICISSQVGCKMMCKFCASSHLGFARNLTSGEMMDQILATIKDTGENINNVVVMGIGEPFDNYNNLIKFLKNLNSKTGLNIGYRHISISTCGLVDKIYDFLKEELPVTLSISLHSADNQIRKKIMPITIEYSIDKLIEACKIYTKTLKRRITFEYILIDGLNDSKKDAFKLVKLIKGLLCHVNLIPVNDSSDLNIKRSNKININKFRNILLESGIETTIRRELGSDIEAACGQLRRSSLNKYKTGDIIFPLNEL